MENRRQNVSIFCDPPSIFSGSFFSRVITRSHLSDADPNVIPGSSTSTPATVDPATLGGSGSGLILSGSADSHTQPAPLQAPPATGSGSGPAYSSTILAPLQIQHNAGTGTSTGTGYSSSTPVPLQTQHTTGTDTGTDTGSSFSTPAPLLSRPPPLSASISTGSSYNYNTLAPIACTGTGYSFTTPAPLHVQPATGSGTGNSFSTPPPLLSQPAPPSSLINNGSSYSSTALAPLNSTVEWSAADWTALRSAGSSSNRFQHCTDNTLSQFDTQNTDITPTLTPTASDYTCTMDTMTNTILGTSYYQTRTARRATNTITKTDIDTNSKKTSQSPTIGSLDNINNICTNFIASRTDNTTNLHQNMSSSFDPSDLTCVRCTSPHNIALQSDHDKPLVFTLSDQNFPDFDVGGGEIALGKFELRTVH